MSYENPTPLQVGASGALLGWRVKITARLVLGVEIDGETYYWNEFQLLGESGNTGTLVFEETEQGPEWKLFRLFEPARPMSAAEAATKRVGDTVNLDGTPTRITLVDQSRVAHIEGTAPEGVELGDVAHYFNADTGRRMLVASWTGDEIEFYEGEDVPATMVAEGFGLPHDARAVSAAGGSSPSSAGSGRRSPTMAVIAIAAVLLFGAVIVVIVATSRPKASSRSRTTSAPPVVAAPPALQLTSGATGRLGTETFTIAGSATIEIGRVRGRQRRREYQLSGDSGAEPRLLVQGLTGAAKEWHLLKPFSSAPAFDPYVAAAQRKNALITLNGRSAHVAELFMAKVLTNDGAANALPAVGAVRYGFLARTNGVAEFVVARWDATEIQYHTAERFTENEILSAFVGPEAPTSK